VLEAEVAAIISAATACTVDEKNEKDVIVCGQFWTISVIV